MMRIGQCLCIMVAFSLLLLSCIESGWAVVLDDDGNVITEEEIKTKSGKPPLEDYRIGREILAGGVGGVVFGTVGGFIGYSLIEKPCGYEFCEFEGIIPGTLIGYTLGNAIGVYLVGNIGNETGSFLATLGGSILGLGIGLAGAAGVSAITPRAIILFASPPIGATIGFNLTRRYTSSPETALIHFNETWSFEATLGGIIIGGLVGGLVGFTIAEVSTNKGYWMEQCNEIIGVASFAGVFIGATIGSYLIRRYKSPHASETALINVRDSQISLAVPTPYFQPDSFDGITPRVDLVKVGF